MFQKSKISDRSHQWPLIHSNVSAPSLVEKKEPHLGHLIRVSFDVDAHPKEKQMTIDIIMNIFIFAFIINPLSKQPSLHGMIKA